MSDPRRPADPAPAAAPPTPSEGGSYLRDPETGALTRIDEAPAAPVEPPTEPAADAELRKPRRRADMET